MSMFILRLHWEDLQAAKAEFKNPFIASHRGRRVPSERAMQESFTPQRGTALLLTAPGRNCSLFHISNLWQLSITPPNTQPEQESFSEPFTEPPPHLYLTRLSQYSQEKHSNKNYPNTCTTQHVLIPESRQTTSNSYKV